MIRRLALVIMMLVLPGAVLAANFIRVINYTADLDQNMDPVGVSWFQRESVQLNVGIVRSAQPVDLSSTNYLAVWEVVSRTNPAQAFVVRTGTFYSAVSAGVTSWYTRFELTPEQSMLQNKMHDGYVRLFERVGGALVDQGFASRQHVNVYFAPNSDSFDFVGPIWWNAFDPNSLSVDQITAHRLVVDEIDFANDLQLSWPTNWPLETGASYSESYANPSYQVYAGKSGSTLYFYDLAAEGGLSMFYTNGLLVISGDPTNSLTSFFPVQTNGVRIYYRSRASPHAMSYADIGETNRYLFFDGTNFVTDAGTAGLASNAVLFAGLPPEYYLDFVNVSNVLQWDDGALATNDVDGWEWGGNLDVEFVARTNGGRTGTYARINSGTIPSTNSTDLLNRSNRWTEANVFEDDVAVEGRMIISDNNNAMGGAWSSTTIGGTNVNASGDYATASGGRDHDASGEGSVSVGGRGGGATAAYAFRGGGYMVSALGVYSAAPGGYDVVARGSYSAAIGGYNVDVEDYGYGLGGEFIDLDGDFNWGLGRFVDSTNDWTFSMGYGASATNPVTAGSNFMFIIHNTATNVPQWRLGINTNHPRGALDLGGGTGYVAAIAFADGSVLSSAGSPGSGTITGAAVVGQSGTGSVAVSGANILLTYPAGGGGGGSTNVTFENLDGNGGVGPASNQVLRGSDYVAGSNSINTRLLALEGGGVTISNARSTNAWLTAVLAGNEVVVGGTSTPIFAESDAIALAQGYMPGAGVSNAIDRHATNMLSKADASNAYVAAAGYQAGSVILTGATVLVATPTAAAHAATKGYVDSVASGGGGSATNAISAGAVNATNYTGLNFLRLRGNAMLDFSSGSTVDVVFLANVVSTQETAFTKPLRVSPDTVADPRQGTVAIAFSPTNYDAAYTISANTITSRSAIVWLSGQTNASGRPVYVMEEARTVAATTSTGNVGFLRQWGPTTALSSNDYFEFRSMYHLWNGAAPIGGGVAFQDHPAAPSEQADVVQWMGESSGVPYFGITTIAAGGDTHTHRLWMNESYLSFNVGSADYDVYFNGDTANQQVFSLDQDTTPRIIINGNGSAVAESTTNSSAATGVDVWVYGTSGAPMMYLNSATKAAQFGGTVNALGGFSASGAAGISSTTSVLVADGGGGFATQTWIHVYGIRTQ